MKKIFIVALSAVILAACGGQASNQKTKKSDATKSKKSNVSIAAAGATFPLPFYNMAFKTYSELTGVGVTYGGIGSGGGIRSLKDQIVEFGGSDAYLSDKEMSEMPSEVVHIPTCMGAVVMAYNLPNIKNIKLTGSIIADIFMGKITKWNDKCIADINKDITLPNIDITPVYRSDGSGTTFIFSDYLTKVSSTWAKDMGTGKSLKWNTGLAGKGNPGVAGTIKQTTGSIGYVGSEYAFALKLDMAQLQNASGNFVLPTDESISAAASGEIADDTRQMITNSTAKNAYPISCFTWVILYKEQAYKDRNKDIATETIELLKWMIGDDAQAMTTKVHYSPLPAAAREKAMNILKSITYNGTPILK